MDDQYKWRRRVLLAVAALLASAAVATAAAPPPGGGGGIRAPQQAPVGGSITVEVAGPDSTVDVSLGGPAVSTYPVDANGRALIPVPSVPPGTVLIISVGRGARRAVVLVEVVAP